ncbi:ATP-binding protein, partial [Hydrogenophilus thiooxidans]|uniref:ATP-binding protein n=1 Tax=Hydrogenophilus thiooxidans TaxID=2820326 RepID=UPI001C24E95E
QTFAKIREHDAYYYVDKTPYALRLIESGTHYFLSRPRRFGKSLFLDTLAELFAGNEPLFRGLYIHDRWDWNVRYPVVRLSFAEGRLETRAELDRRIRSLLAHNARTLGVELPLDADIAETFICLIEGAHARYGERVVVLVDEYDKPILDNLTTPDVARAMREGLRNLYSVIKGQDAHIRFAFLTGVSKFSKVSIFSGLNNLRDITVSAEYSAICGYTEEDLETVFAPELAGLDRSLIRHWYNGYNWLGEAVYNPFDLLLLFQERQFRPYWFETGTPTFLIEWLRAHRTFTPKLERLFATEELLSAFDVDRMRAEALLWQTGYLTFAERIPSPGLPEYYLRLPNQEVRIALNHAILHAWLPEDSDWAEGIPTLRKALRRADLTQLRHHLERLYASIPHDWYRANPIAHYEGYWASVFYSHLAALGLELIAEDVTNHGCI